MELGETEAVGIFYEHDGGAGYVYTDFDDGGGDEDVGLTAAEGCHGLFALVAGHAGMEGCDSCVFEEPPLESLVDLFDSGHLFAFDRGDDDESLLALCDALGEDFIGVGSLGGAEDSCFNWLSARGELVDGGLVEVAEEGHGDGAGDGGRGHDQDMGG